MIDFDLPRRMNRYDYDHASNNAECLYWDRFNILIKWNVARPHAGILLLYMRTGTSCIYLYIPPATSTHSFVITFSLDAGMRFHSKTMGERSK